MVPISVIIDPHSLLCSESLLPMGSSVYVKVVGFTDVERHALNTLFRLSSVRPTAYSLWTPDLQVAPHLALIDVDAYEAGLELASPSLNPRLKMICVGHDAPANAWRTFERPINWPEIVKAIDSLFAPSETKNEDGDYCDTVAGFKTPPGFKVTLLVDPSREDRMYLRARLALAGHAEVDDAQTGEQALALAKKRRYDLIVVGLDVPDMDGWELIRQLVNLEPAIGRIVVTTSDTGWHMRERAESAGVGGLLDKPYNPQQIVQMLQNI
jgi:CheY-like chemotaxis protein